MIPKKPAPDAIRGGPGFRRRSCFESKGASDFAAEAPDAGASGAFFTWQPAFPGRPNARLTARAVFLMSAGGTPLPTEGRLSGRIGHDDDALCAADRAAFLLRPLCQAPW